MTAFATMLIAVLVRFVCKFYITMNLLIDFTAVANDCGHFGGHYGNGWLGLKDYSEIIGLYMR
jgi:hypothetical protein